MKYGYLIFIIFLFLLNKIYSNEIKIRRSIQIIHADLIQNNIHNQAFVLTGNVHLKYDEYHLFCDKIIYYKINNKFYGYGNVRLVSIKNKIISQNIVGNIFDFQLSGKVVLYQKKIKLTADIIHYNFKKKSIQAINNVILFFNKIKLTTNILEYNLILNQIFYNKKSIIHYRDYTICSEEGFFYIKKKKIELKHKIKLISKIYTVYANTLEYLFEQDKIHFHNTVIIVQNTNFDNFIYAKKAQFLVKKSFFLFKNYVSIHYNGQIVKGEYLFFDYKKKHGFIKNILLEYSNKKYFLMSGYGKFDLNFGFLILKKNPKIIQISKNDSIFICSNILKIKIGKNYKYSIQAYSVNVKCFFLNETIQGKCEYFNFDSSNDYMQFNGNPIFWFQNKQITGKIIYIHFRKKNNNLLKCIKIFQNASYIEKINSKEFNHIEGDIMTGFFNEENDLEKVMIEGNINSIIFIYPDQEKKIIHKLSCNTLSIYLDKSKKIRKFSYAKEVRSELIPIHKETPNEFLYLSKFSWKKIDKPKENKKSFVFKEINKYEKESLLEKKQITTMIKNK
ncbi:OstA-like protein [Blattabacterium cuenoti]|uniref:OstA-like protein n=1 Tax=Blattabacterium cuenoti TaxID=1653831 RepID=UPI001EEB114E|nr:LptA/OstA family protein [Blattabacterium cuenoti]